MIGARGREASDGRLTCVSTGGSTFKKWRTEAVRKESRNSPTWRPEEEAPTPCLATGGSPYPLFLGYPYRVCPSRVAVALSTAIATASSTSGTTSPTMRDRHHQRGHYAAHRNYGVEQPRPNTSLNYQYGPPPGLVPIVPTRSKAGGNEIIAGRHSGNTARSHRSHVLRKGLPPCACARSLSLSLVTEQWERWEREGGAPLPSVENLVPTRFTACGNDGNVRRWSAS